MSNILSKFQESNFDAVDNPDRVGGGYSPIESGVYNASITNAYLTKSAGGAYGVVFNLVVHTPDQSRNYRETIWISNRNGDNFYENSSNGQKSPLPGFMTVNECMNLLTGFPLSSQETEDLFVSIYDAEAGKEIPKEVPVFTVLSGSEIKVAIQKQLVFKQEKTDNGYVATEETREQNQIIKFLAEDTGKTWFETQGSKDATYKEAWEAQWAGKVYDQTTRKRNSRPAAAKPKQETPKKVTKSLFQ